jgi:hypothetical protein
MEEKCENCKFYRNGECHRLPPQTVNVEEYRPSYDKDTPSTTEVAVVTQWPDVDEDDWCGEFKRKKA